MIEFNREKHTFQITVQGDEHEYLAFLRALSRIIANVDEEALDKESIYYASTLLEVMLPSAGQNVKIE